MWVMAALPSILLYLWDERFTKPFRDGVLHPNASCASDDEQNGKENNSKHDFPRFHGDTHRPNENKMSDGGRERASDAALEAPLGFRILKNYRNYG